VFDPRVIRWRLDVGDRAAQLMSLSELRHGFEPAAAALAARRADPHQCRIMAAAVSDMVVHGRSGDLEAYLLADKIFHRTLLEASGNEMFRALNDVVAEVLGGRTHHGMMPARPNPAAIELHDEVARAIRLRDEAAAERAMRAIIDESAAGLAGDLSTSPSENQVAGA
jgi:DNA-binding FadR family transcriptional regulator